ncbi:hypothetical protein [Nocardioides acrostichi]|uniref:hypothetical protein n=1 Tax=Nocardioides acrostichi TaxID=2784339 RepID=UPI001A9CABF3|nr:hypothetical protein [Nocardioides acrostichi]
MDEIARLLRQQDGVVARRQLLAIDDVDRTAVTRTIRRRELVTVHAGVYVGHNGSLTWLQRAWTAVLWAGPEAALTGESALRAYDGPGRTGRDARVL